MRKVRVAGRFDSFNWFGLQGLHAHVWLAILCSLVCVITNAPTAAEQNAKSVLFLYDYSFGSLDLLESSVRARTPGQVNFYVQYLENSRFSEDGYEAVQLETLRHICHGKRLDVVIVQLYPAFQFVLRHRKELLPGVPIVFLDIDARRVAGQNWPDVTGVTDTVGIQPTIDLAFHLQPKTDTVAIIAGNSEYENLWLTAEHEILTRDHPHIKVVDLIALPTSQLLAAVAELPRQTIVLYQDFPKPSIQPAIGADDILLSVAQLFPTYCIIPEFCLNHGGIGGAESGGNQEIPLAAELTSRILAGDRTENIPVVHNSSNQIRLDWRQIQRWNIPVSALPPGSVILNRPPTFWERDRKYIIVALVLIIIQALLIAGLLIQRARKRRAEAILRESEERFRLAAQAGRMFAYQWDVASDIIERSPEAAEILGMNDAEQTTGQQVLAMVHPEDRERVSAAVAALSPEKPHLQVSFREVRPDGTIIWVERSSRAQFDRQGKLQRVVGMVADVTERKRAEEERRESESRFQLVADTAPVLIWMSGPDKLCTYFNKSWLDFTGRSIDSELGNGWAEGVYHEDLQGCLGVYVQAFDRREKFRMEYRLRRHDGEYRWVLDIGVPRFSQDRSFLGYIGVAVDITERKGAEDALAGVSRRLLEAQERERSRIARELHDDICQQLALLSMELDQMNRNPQRLPTTAQDNLKEIRKHCSEIADDVQSLSHQLHSSKLDYLGIAAAIKGFGNEFSKQHKVNVEFTSSNVPGQLQREISLCLFRVAQEALHNAVKYSGTSRYTVELTGTDDAVQLIVSDLGAGFDVEGAKQNRGLGLVSMQERLHLVRGTLRVESEPGSGTKIIAIVPLVGNDGRGIGEENQRIKVA